MVCYAIRRARSSEPGRWVICVDGRPNDVRGTRFSTQWGARRVARRWTKQDEKATKTYPV